MIMPFPMAEGTGGKGRERERERKGGREWLNTTVYKKQKHYKKSFQSYNTGISEFMSPFGLIIF